MNKIIPVPAGDGGPWRQQALLGRGRWDADALRDIVRDYVIGHLGDNHAVLVIDETGFLKQGKASCGVGRQYTGSAGKITNCQIGVFASYVSNKVGDTAMNPSICSVQFAPSAPWGQLSSCRRSTPKP
jgi:SRSO17 transposase